ncbi:multicopper oxidase family protein [Brevibacillus sp. 179-C 1.1 NHS]|uniref:multicopper oxidase family protein n=1 Tax=Brevibacillus sp. 179-C 1.1 NHS TaxID=3235177 RepID=UPI0039A07010
MLETIAGIIVALVMTVLWGWASLIVTMLPASQNDQRLKSRKTLLIWVSCIALVIDLIWCLLVMSQFVRYGWLFVEGIIKVIVPIMLIGHLPVAMYVLPKLRTIQPAQQESISADTLAKLSHPGMVIPFYAAAITSVMNVASHVFAQPVMPSLFELVQLPFLLLLILFVPFLFVRRKYQAVRRGEFAQQKRGRELLQFGLMSVITTGVVITVMVVHVLAGIQSSKLPEASDMMNHHLIDEGGGVPTMTSDHQNHGNHSNMVEVAALTGDISAPADSKFELVAQTKVVTLSSGAKIDAWTYNGEIAPELRVRQGDIVEVKLSNKDIDKGVTIHWHGYNVPNAMDGVPGMTQNVVKPGQSFTYKFQAKQAGTYWFHSHQQAAEQVVKGLFGSLIVDPRNETEGYEEEFTVMNHRWDTDQGKKTAFGYDDQPQWKHIQSGKKVKLRIINTHNQSQKYLLQGTDYQITSIDGVRIQDPDRLSDRTAFRLGSGGRYDVTFTMPDMPVLFKIGDYQDEKKPSMIFYPDTPPASPSFEAESDMFDPSQYGKPVQNEVTSAAQFDREFNMILGNRMGFYNGQFHFLWTINGEVYPRTPTFVVKEGERVKTTFVNKSLAEHPMHLHGHHMTVLRKNGKQVMTPWMTDTLNVLPGETYDVAFVADNPGMWMDHCHNLDHAATGMVLHLMYDHVLPSYEVGTKSGNLPD